MMPIRRENHGRAASGGRNHDRNRRWWTTSTRIQSFSVNMIAACSLLWIMTLRRSILWHLFYQRQNTLASETSDFEKHPLGSSLETFGDYHHNNATKKSTLELPANNSLASMNLPLWMKGILRFASFLQSSAITRYSSLCFFDNNRIL
jgi:hypothetical protein